ncbi:PIR protein,putative [Plasmodium sp.]|nr:PIR protein,putative [Plasmodium sp.]
MISYIFKFIIFSIILGTLNLIYNNDCDRLYKNINNKNNLEIRNNFKSLAELLPEPRTNHISEKLQFKEYEAINKKKYTKIKYSNDDSNKKQKLEDVSGKENDGVSNSKKHKKEKYQKEKDPKSISSSRSFKYMEIQRKLYNNFYVKPEIDFEDFTDKTKNKSCECPNKKKPSSKVHDKYRDYLEKGCAGGACMCGISSESAVFGSWITIGAAGAKITSASVDTAAKATLTGALGGGAVTALNVCGITVLVLIIAGYVLMILCIWLYSRKKNSWKH